jgi:hypothetical protein
MRWHYRFGLKFMLATVMLAALILGWVVPVEGVRSGSRFKERQCVAKLGR